MDDAIGQPLEIDFLKEVGMKKVKRLVQIFGLIFLLILILVSINVYRGFTGGSRIDVTRLRRSNHPLFAEPITQDGSVDYVAAINRVLGRDVDVDNNFGVALLELLPFEGFFNSEILADFQSRLPCDIQSPDRFPSAADIQAIMGTDVSLKIRQATLRSFQEDNVELEALQKGLDLYQPALRKLRRQLDRRSDYYMPIYETEGQSGSLVLPRMVQQIGEILNADAYRQMAEGNLPAAWKNIRANYQFGQRVSKGPFLLDWLVAVTLHVMAERQLLELMNQPGLTEDLLTEIAEDLKSVGSMNSVEQTLDIGERGMLLDTIDTMVDGKETSVSEAMEKDWLPHIPWGWVDTIAMGDDLNSLVDQIIQIGRMTDYRQAKAEAKQWEQWLMTRSAIDWRAARLLVGIPPRKEATEQALQRFTPWLMPEVSAVYEIQLRNVISERLGRIAVAARQYEFKQGHLPNELSELQSYLEPQELIDPELGFPFQVSLTPNEWSITSTSVFPGVLELKLVRPAP